MQDFSSILSSYRKHSMILFIINQNSTERNAGYVRASFSYCPLLQRAGGTSFFNKEICKVAAEMKEQYNVDFEFLFVNDGSKDHTLDILREMASRDPRVKYISFHVISARRAPSMPVWKMLPAITYHSSMPTCRIRPPCSCRCTS